MLINSLDMRSRELRKKQMKFEYIPILLLWQKCGSAKTRYCLVHVLHLLTA